MLFRSSYLRPPRSPDCVPGWYIPDSSECPNRPASQKRRCASWPALPWEPAGFSFFCSFSPPPNKKEPQPVRNPYWLRLRRSGSGSHCFCNVFQFDDVKFFFPLAFFAVQRHADQNRLIGKALKLLPALRTAGPGFPVYFFQHNSSRTRSINKSPTSSKFFACRISSV